MTHPAATMSERHKVVIIGSGFGGLTAAKTLKRADVDIKLIARTTHHLFQPLLYQVATGIISEGEIAPATRVILRKQKNVQVLLGDVTGINLATKTVRSELLGHTYVTPYDSLIIAAGAGQSYFGNDHFAEFAPGMKSIDDALELRGRILGAFEQAERSSDPSRREKLLTFVVVGAGPTGVEMAGQIAELADHTLKGAFRHIDSTKARVILLDAAPSVLPPMGEKLGKKAQDRLEKMGVEIQLNAMVTDVDRNGITVKDPDGTIRRIEAACKVWSAGVSASPLGRDLADQSDVELDRAGRVKVLPDLSIPGHPNVFVVGDMASVEDVPGMAQGAIQGAKYAAKAIEAGLKGADPDQREPFSYFDKGSMATVSKFSAVAKVGPLEFGGFIAWLAWLVLHLVYLVGFKTKITTLLSWTVTFLGRNRGQLTITEQQAYARTRIEELEEIAASVDQKAAS
ncbi:NAD(P)/FAD-dependent oxidoreductase [Mycolicibacterium sp. CR10]|mgnify:FL=1|uniref:NAD(P)/FAD-dependent oxidoreductase n=1 Tax=Mycolicibacterium sp. CR10 TaxID=2562314 RepID=UPI0010C01A82|nr:NAD(P)/FAD-dependent oxidoreductase [Mycolicibacterium sp. CR10]